MMNRIQLVVKGGIVVPTILPADNAPPQIVVAAANFI